MSGRTITRADLSEAVYQEVGLSRSELAELLESVLGEIIEALGPGRHGQAVLVRDLLHPAEGPADRPQPQDRRGGADPAAQGPGVSPLPGAEDPHQGKQKARRRGRTRRMSVETGAGGIPAKEPAPSAGSKSPSAFRTITEVASELDLPQHVLRFWETKFPQIRPMKRRGGRRYYRPEDVVLLREVRRLLYVEGYTIRGVQKLLRQQSRRALAQPPAHPDEARGGGRRGRGRPRPRARPRRRRAGSGPRRRGAAHPARGRGRGGGALPAAQVAARHGDVDRAPQGAVHAALRARGAPRPASRSRPRPRRGARRLRAGALGHIGRARGRCARIRCLYSGGGSERGAAW